MRLSMSLSANIFAGILGLVGLFSAPMNAEPPTKNTPRRTAAQLLEMRTSVDLSQTPLDEGLEIFADHYNVNLLIDDVGLKQLDVAKDIPITFSAEMIPFKEILRGMLEPQGLAYVVDDDIIVITSPEEAKRIAVGAAKQQRFLVVRDAIVTVSFTDEPLDKAVQSLAKELELKVVAGHNVFLEAKRPETLRLKNVSAKSALKYLLRPQHLTYAIRDSELVISQAAGKAE